MPTIFDVKEELNDDYDYVYEIDKKFVEANEAKSEYNLRHPEKLTKLRQWRFLGYT